MKKGRVRRGIMNTEVIEAKNADAKLQRWPDREE
jgi:hypothetical protein